MIVATTKQPSATSLKRALAISEGTISKLTKDMEQQKTYREMYSKQADEAKKELESIHSLLDVLPNALARKTVPPGKDEWQAVEHSLMTRLAAYLALRGN